MSPLDPAQVAAQADRLRAEGPSLRNLGFDRRLQALAKAAAALADPETDRGRQARDLLPATTGLSRQMVDWALKTTLNPITPEALQGLVQMLPQRLSNGLEAEAAKTSESSEPSASKGGGEPGGSPAEEAKASGRLPAERTGAPDPSHRDPTRNPPASAPEGPDFACRRSGAPSRLERAAYLPVPPTLATIILAGNIFTAAARPILLALLAGAPILCKASTQDDLFPNLFAAALQEADPAVAAALAVLTFPGGTQDLEAPLLERSDAILVYGSDATIQSLRARTPPTARLLEHGHGVGAAYVPAAVLANPDDAAKAAASLALDVAAYDQRGCLSPQAVWVEGGTEGRTGHRFADLVSGALERWQCHLPRGPLPIEAAAAQSQWTGVLTAMAQLYRCDGGAAAWTDNPALPSEGGLPWGPGYRHLLVLPCDSPEDFARRLAPLGPHLKAVGVGGGPADLRRVATALPPPLCPRLGPLGRMQIPPLATCDDGAPPFEGLLRWRHLVE